MNRMGYRFDISIVHLTGGSNRPYLPMSYTIQRQVRLDQTIADALKALADKRGETVSDVIRKAIEAEIIMSKYQHNL